MQASTRSAMDARWSRLKPDSPDSKLRLFIKPQISPSSYTVLITDLCHIWEESLDRKQIIRRALELETSIDPTEGLDQLQLLLEKIESAVHGSKGTSVKLARRGPDLALRLRLTIPLPAPLEDLKWEMAMTPSSEVGVKEHLTLPLLAKAQEQRSQIDDLIGHLNAKDHVITKLLDKLEGTGFDLSSVFPGIAGTRGSKHSTPREQVARQVHGVGAFDVESWRSSRNFTSSTDDSLILSAISSMRLHGEGEIDVVDRWLSRLPADFDEARREEPVRRIIESGAEGLVQDASGTQDDDVFERQATPPHLRKTKPDLGKLSDDDDLDAPPKKTSQSRPNTQTSSDASQVQQQPSQIGPRKLGKLGGAVKTSSPPENTPSSSRAMERPTIASPKKLGKLGGLRRTPSAEVPAKEDEAALQKTSPESETETEDEADLDQPKSSKATEDKRPIAEAATKPPPTRGNMGRIGGGRKPAASLDAPTSRPHALCAVGAESAETGAGKRVEQTSPTSEGARSVAKARGSSSSLTRSLPSADEPQESEEQRANRKREELKRSLSSNPQPSKKKRRF
ncbi:XRCC4-like factor-domain-containing protein [Phyllosticta citrichinensis]|uniref:Non-homologous end-joining factor 1 n=1 Tax=Phyllosticta citrichinensis TaxID=1130410 RepID=A0ABR1XTK7_9PEZI